MRNLSVRILISAEDIAMKQRVKLNSRKVLRQIQSNIHQLEAAIQSGDDFGQLHSDIIRLLKIVCRTKTEYKDILRYPAPPAVRETVIMVPGPNGKPAEHERISHFSEESLQQSQKELGARLLAKLTELREEYLLRSKLEITARRTYGTDLKNIKKELANIKSELLRLRQVSRT